MLLTNNRDYANKVTNIVINTIRSSSVAQRPRDASCHRIFC